MATTTRRAETRPREVAGDILREARDTVGGATAEVEARLSDAAAATGAGVKAANASLRSRSDVSLGLIFSYAIGLTTGLVLGGAHRLLIAASLVPTALVGGVILERFDRPRRTKDASGS